MGPVIVSDATSTTARRSAGDLVIQMESKDSIPMCQSIHATTRYGHERRLSSHAVIVLQPDFARALMITSCPKFREG